MWDVRGMGLDILEALEAITLKEQHYSCLP
jgi:hypothetical protein